METSNLNVHPQILDLYEALEQSGLHKEKEEVQSLVGYIESMEYNLSVMMFEIQEMHSEVNQLQNKGVRVKCDQIVTKAEDKIRQAKTMVSITKVKMIQSAENAVKSFKEKGKSALVQAVAADSRRSFCYEKRSFLCDGIYAAKRRTDRFYSCGASRSGRAYEKRRTRTAG